jgi:hypothetical protein
MNSSELLEAFRSGVGAEASRRLSDDDVWRIANDAYYAFVRLTGGVADVTSEACQVQLVADQATSVLHRSLLRLMNVFLRSTGDKVQIVNQTDIHGRPTGDDYGRALNPLSRQDFSTGPVRFAVIGTQRGLVRWYKVPLEDDIADLSIYRLPLNKITGDGQELSDVDEEHHLALLDHMYCAAYMHPEVAGYQAAGAHKAKFEEYCREIKREIERYKHKDRVVQYGGL